MSARIVECDSIEMLDQLFIRSRNEPVVLFKHSDSCSISYNVFQDLRSANAEINVVVVQTARGVSDSVAERTGIRHQSPQAIVLMDGKAVYHASHYDITAADVETRLARHLR